jgi:hypothetical protein
MGAPGSMCVLRCPPSPPAPAGAAASNSDSKAVHEKIASETRFRVLSCTLMIRNLSEQKVVSMLYHRDCVKSPLAMADLNNFTPCWCRVVSLSTWDEWLT